MDALDIGLLVSGMSAVTVLMIVAVWKRLGFSSATYLLSFQALGFFYYSASLAFYFYESMDNDERLILGRLVFMGSTWVSVATLYFVAAFCNRPLKHWLHSLFAAIGAVILVMNLLGLVVIRVVQGSQMIYHPVGYSLVFAHSTLGIVIGIYYLAKERGFQYNAMLIILGLAYICTIFSNGVLRWVVGDSRYSLLGILFMNMYSIGSILLLLYGQQIVLGRNLNRIYAALGLEAWEIFGDPMMTDDSGYPRGESTELRQKPAWLIKQQSLLLRKHQHMLDHLELMGDSAVTSFIQQNRPDLGEK